MSVLNTRFGFSHVNHLTFLLQYYEDKTKECGINKNLAKFSFELHCINRVRWIEWRSKRADRSKLLVPNQAPSFTIPSNIIDVGQSCLSFSSSFPNFRPRAKFSWVAKAFRTKRSDLGYCPDYGCWVQCVFLGNTLCSHRTSFYPEVEYRKIKIYQ